MIDVKELRATMGSLLLSSGTKRKGLNRWMATPMDGIACTEGQAPASSGRRITTPMDPIPRSESEEAALNKRRRTTPMDPIPRAESPSRADAGSVRKERGAKFLLLVPGSEDAHTRGRVGMAGMNLVERSNSIFEPVTMMRGSNQGTRRQMADVGQKLGPRTTVVAQEASPRPLPVQARAVSQRWARGLKVLE